MCPPKNTALFLSHRGPALLPALRTTFRTTVQTTGGISNDGRKSCIAVDTLSPVPAFQHSNHLHFRPRLVGAAAANHNAESFAPRRPIRSLQSHAGRNRRNETLHMERSLGCATCRLVAKCIVRSDQWHSNERRKRQ